MAWIHLPFRCICRLLYGVSNTLSKQYLESFDRYESIKCKRIVSLSISLPSSSLLSLPFAVSCSPISRFHSSDLPQVAILTLHPRIPMFFTISQSVYRISLTPCSYYIFISCHSQNILFILSWLILYNHRNDHICIIKQSIRLILYYLFCKTST